MAESAAHLVDHVLLHVSMRQWVWRPRTVCVICTAPQEFTHSI
jgi:hypothetical protein